MAKDLNGKKVAILVAKGFEQVELTDPKAALEEAGAKTDIVSIEKETVRAWNHSDWGEEFDVDVHIADARADDYDALVLPGGVMNPDRLRIDAHAVGLTRDMFNAGKPIAAICHGPWMLVEADVVRSLRVTSWPSIRTAECSG